MPKLEHLGHAGLAGWREKVADGIGPRAAERTPASEDQIRAIVGAAFFLLSLYYVATSIARMVKAARG